MNLVKLAVFVACVQVLGCTSSTYGNSFVAVPTNQSAAVNHYTLKVYTGGFAGPEYAKKDLDTAAKAFMQQNPRFVSYKIVSEQFELVPSGVTFVVEFLEKTN